MKVKAFAVDLIQDDFLGEGITDAAGHFKIYYTKADFSKTIFNWLNIEWPAGPDLYFSVETGAGTVILQEPRSRGHQKDREIAPNCFCVELCVKTEADNGTYAPVLFQKVGQYWIASDFDANGFTDDSERNAFTGTIPLTNYRHLRKTAGKSIGSDIMRRIIRTEPAYGRCLASSHERLSIRPSILSRKRPNHPVRRS